MNFLALFHFLIFIIASRDLAYFAFLGYLSIFIFQFLHCESLFSNSTISKTIISLNRHINSLIYPHAISSFILTLPTQNLFIFG